MNRIRSKPEILLQHFLPIDLFTLLQIVLEFPFQLRAVLEVATAPSMTCFTNFCSIFSSTIYCFLRWTQVLTKTEFHLHLYPMFNTYVCANSKINGGADLVASRHHVVDLAYALLENTVYQIVNLSHSNALSTKKTYHRKNPFKRPTIVLTEPILVDI